jgi:hypothetical protein
MEIGVEIVWHVFDVEGMVYLQKAFALTHLERIRLFDHMCRCNMAKDGAGLSKDSGLKLVVYLAAGHLVRKI